MTRLTACLSAAALALTLVAGPARGAQVTVPVDVGVGPAGHIVFGQVASDQLFHYGVKLNVAAIIDQQTIKANQNRIPAKYRAAAARMDEVRISPSIFIPDTLYISPKTRYTGMFGATWRPIGFNVPLLRGPVRFTVGAGALLTYAFITSDTLAGGSDTHFLRPGVDLKAELEVMFVRSFGISLGWSSGFYLPQAIGGAITKVPDVGPDVIWHIGQVFAMLHFRFPYTANL